jgi:hypothetical protein
MAESSPKTVAVKEDEGTFAAASVNDCPSSTSSDKINANVVDCSSSSASSEMTLLLDYVSSNGKNKHTLLCLHCPSKIMAPLTASSYLKQDKVSHTYHIKEISSS